MTEPARPSLNADEPWPGLAAFEEADTAYFRGRSAEAAELVRLVRRESLTVLFGRSGLGKTSLLRAGLFPLLRGEDMLPVYVRPDYGASAPPLRDQVFLALRSAADAVGVQGTQPRAGDALWSLFHRRDTEFWSALNRPVTPVLVIDQFEEVFTLGRQDAGAHARADAFLEELADLIENRPPLAVKEALERDPSAARVYEFRRATVKVVLSFREDFLPEIEGLKASMPSVMKNRQRLMPMDGRQAYAVVSGAGGALVDDEVARCILRLAWRNEPTPAVADAEFAGLEIDPALLSVVCRELNHKRLHAKPPLPRITHALLAGADREILAGFYERCMTGMDARVRAFVEDELITDRGYRDSHDWEDALALPGVTQAALDELIARRLLRTEERQGRRRLELTHDVLTRVVMASRDRRQFELAAQAEREREHKRRQRQRRLVASGAVASVAAVSLIVTFAWMLGRSNAKQRELEQTQSRVLFDRANARFDLRVPAEPPFDLAKALELDRTNDSAIARALAYLHQRSFPERLAQTRYTLAPGAVLGDVGWTSPGQVSLRQDDGLIRQLAVPAPATAASAPERTAPRRELPSVHAGDTWGPEGGDPFVQAGDVQVWLQQGRELRVAGRAGREPSQGVEIDQPRWPVVLSVDGTRAMLRAGERHVLVFGLAAGQAPRLLHRIDAEQGSLRFGPGGTRLMALTGQVATLYDLEADRLHRLQHPMPVNLLALGPEDTVVATACQDQQARLWDTATGDPVGAPMRHGGSVLALDFSADGRRLLTGAQDGTARLWAVPSTRPMVEPLIAAGAVPWVRFGPSGDRALVVDDAAQLSFWRLSDPSPAQVVLDIRVAVSASAFEPGHALLALAGADGSLALWRVVSGPTSAPVLEQRWRRQLAAPAGRLAIADDGRTLAFADARRRVQLVDANTGEDLGPPQVHQGEVLSLTFGAGGTTLVTGAADGAARVFDVATRQRIGFPFVVQQESVIHAELSPDGAHLLTAASTAGGETVVRLWSLTPRTQVTVASGRHLALASFTTARSFVTVIDRAAQQWSVARSPRLSVSRDHEALALTQLVLRAALSRDRGRLALGGIDGVTRSVDVPGWKIVGEAMKGAGQVASAAYTANGRWLLIRDSTGSARVWDGQRGVVVTDALTGAGALQAAHIDATGALALTVGEAGQVAVQRLGLDFPTPMPDWLPELLRSAAGARIDERGNLSWARDRGEQLAWFGRIDSSDHAWWRSRGREWLARLGAAPHQDGGRP